MRTPAMLTLMAVVIGAIAAAAVMPWVLALSEAHAVASVPPPPKSTAQMRLFAELAKPGRPFTVTAYIRGHRPGQTVTLLIAPGLHLVKGQQEQQVVSWPGKEGYSQVTWRLMAEDYGEYRLIADLDDVIAEEQVNVRSGCDFDG